MSAARFTTEQRAAIDDRGGSALLAANAGSGKTAVMVERFVEAVRLDGVPVGGILALTFTEKAAGELRERVRRRLAGLGEAEHARAVDGAWIGTIHGFCARLLRARPLAVGLDPRFAVLDEPTARRLAARAYETALDAWVAGGGPAALDVAAAYGPGLREVVLGAHATLRSRGELQPRLPIPAPRPLPDPAALAAARAEAAVALAAAADGRRISEGRAALEACTAALEAAAAAGATPLPSALDAGRLGSGARVLTEAPCEAYRTAWDAYRGACADHHARIALVAIDELLGRFGVAYAAAKAARAGVDFEDLELQARELLSDEAERRRWAERFALIMVDEFQDTNPLQLDLLESLERENLFAVGDEFQSIYRFRHADVAIFRRRRQSLPGGSVRGLTANFRSAGELLDALNGAFGPVLGTDFRPLVAGRVSGADGDGDLRLFDPDPARGDAPVELLVTDTRGWEDAEIEPALGLAALATQPWRRAEARLVAHRLREEVDAGRRPGDVVVLVRATASLRLFEQALEEQGLPTYVVGGRGYWSREQVRDGLAYLAALANPRDEHAFYAVLASPFCGVGSDALVLLAQAGREEGSGAWGALRVAAAGPSPWLAALALEERARLLEFAAFFAAERDGAERDAAEALLERAIVATGYDLAILARAGGERRLANLRKLMRLAREYERAEGRDLRAFVAFAGTQDLAEAREGDAALESEGLDAVRLMTIHRAKGLEFPVVCVADLGRLGVQGRPRLLLGRDGTVGLRLAALGGGDAVPALAYERLAAEEDREEAQEERRLFYVAMTRARDRLILSGGVDCGRWPDPRVGGAPIDWIARALAGDPPQWGAGVADGIVALDWDGRGARVRCRLNAPSTLDVVLPRSALDPEPRPRATAPGTALPAAPRVMPEPPPRPRAGAQRLSYSSLGAYERCAYRFYLERVLRLPRVAPPAPLEPAAPAAAGLEGRVRGTLVHLLLEELDFARPQAPDPAAVAALARDQGVEASAADIADILALVAAFAASPTCERLASAQRLRREAPFAFALEPGGAGPLVSGFLDVLATEPGGTLVLDYKTDRLGDAEPAELVDRDYDTQRMVYALAALRDGPERVEVAYCFLERPGDPVRRSFAQADAGGLAERVSLLASGVVEERYPVTGRPQRDLCGDCPGRRALCSWPEAMTLRDPAAAAAQPSAGTFDGSGGPS